MKKFVLYTDKCKVVKEYQKDENGNHIKLDVPVESYTQAVWRHSFACSLSEALVQWRCFLQLFSMHRFYYSITTLENGTKFNLFLLPLVYLYALIERKELLKIKII